MFDSMIASITMYGAEVWGWKKQPEIERIQIKYIKWILGLEKSTPSYIVLDETKRDEMEIRSGKRALNYEEKIVTGKTNEIVKKCWEEKKRAQTRNEQTE